MTFPRIHKISLTVTGLAIAATMALTGLVTTPADAGTRMNEQYYRMSKGKYFNLCNRRNAAIICSKRHISCGCDDGVYLWVWDPGQQGPMVIRMRSPSRIVAGLGGGNDPSGGRGGRGQKP